MLERHAELRAFSRAWAKTGNRTAARMAMMAITTSSSISVNAFLLCMVPPSAQQCIAHGDGAGRNHVLSKLTLLYRLFSLHHQNSFWDRLRTIRYHVRVPRKPSDSYGGGSVCVDASLWRNP